MFSHRNKQILCVSIKSDNTVGFFYHRHSPTSISASFNMERLTEKIKAKMKKLSKWFLSGFTV